MSKVSEITIPYSWRIKPLSAICNVVSGGTPSRDVPEYWEPREIAWVTPTDITGNDQRLLLNSKEKISQKGLTNSSAKLLPANTVLMTSRATLGEMKISGIECCTNQGFKSLVPKDNIDPWFLYYQMKRKKPEYERLGIGSTFLEVNKKDTDTFLVEVPDYSTQKKIAKILTTIDQLIEKTQALIDKHTAIKQGMMSDLFTRGIDPTTGQLRPPVEQAAHLYKETELGWVPKEWKVKRLRNVAVKIQDGTHFSPQTSEGDYLYLTSKNIRFGYLELENIERISESEHNSIYARCDVKYGDLLLTKDGANTGNAALNTINEPFSMLSSVAFIRTDGKLAHVDFLLHYLLSLEGQKRLKELMSGNAIPRLTLTKINNFKVFQPVGSEQQLIADRLNSTKEKVDREKCYLEKLKEMKEGLMQDLLTGRVTTNA